LPAPPKSDADSSVIPSRNRNAVHERSLVVAYGLMLVVTAAALVVRLLLDPLLGHRVPFITMFSSVIFTAWYCGRGPALVSLALGSIVVVYFVLEPRYSLVVDEFEYRIGLALFVVTGLGCIAAFDALERARQRVEEKNQQLEREVTARRAAEKVLAEREELLRITFASIGDAVITTDSNGNVTYLNSVAQRLTGWDPEEAVGQPVTNVFNIINDESRQPVENPVEKALREGKVVGLANHTVLVRKNGGECFIDDSAAPIRNDAGQILGVVLVFRDISDRRHAEFALHQANRRKDEFLAHMSHEIRTPLLGVIGMTDLALETELTDRQRGYLNSVKQSAEFLLNVINDILDFSKIEAGRLELDPVFFPLRKSLNEMLKPLVVRAQQKNLGLVVHVQPETPDSIHGDRGRLQQVLFNLVGNAIKFTERGGIEIQILVASRTPHTVTIHFSIADTGIGIPEEKLEFIFDPFEQVDGSMDRRFGGTGLGLTICRRLVGMMGGRIWVESRIGQGSVFHFTICVGLDDRTGSDALELQVAEPRTPMQLLDVRPGSADERAPHFPPETPPRSLNILVAEDNEVSQKVIVTVLQNSGQMVVAVNNGREAVEALERRSFDLVLMDVQMPDMDGLTATARIREREKTTGQHVPIIACTAHMMKGDRERILAAGMDGFVSKPVRQAELWQAIRECVPALTGTEFPSQPVGLTGDIPTERQFNPIFDPNALLVMVGGKNRLRLDVMRLFLRESPQQMAELSEAVTQRRAELIRKVLHKLMGTFKILCAPTALAEAERLSELVSGGDVTLIDDAFAALHDQVGHLELAVAKYIADDNG
jgi:PAS domain S-box-containing protein